MELYSKVPKVTSNNGKTYYDIATGYYNILEDKDVYKRQVLRDKISVDPVKVILDNKEDYEFAKNYLKDDENAKIVLYTDTRALFDAYEDVYKRQ